MNREEVKAWVEAHEFPIQVKFFRLGHIDLDGKPIPARVLLYYQRHEGTRVMEDDEDSSKIKMFGRYMDKQSGECYWVSLSDADYFAQRIMGYARAQF